MQPWTEKLEERSLDLVADLQVELAGALASLAGKPHPGLPDPYVGYSAGQVNRAAEGFVFLRRAGRIQSCKLLVRPTIEVMFRLMAIRKKPETLFQIAYGEMRDDMTYFREWSKKSGLPFDEVAFLAKWDAFKKAYSAKFPGQTLVEEKLRMVDIARYADLADYYNSHYRLYCQFTHSAFRVLTGSLDEGTDPLDNSTMALCVFSTLQSAAGIGGNAPNLDALRDRLDHLYDP